MYIYNFFLSSAPYFGGWSCRGSGIECGLVSSTVLGCRSIPSPPPQHCCPIIRERKASEGGMAGPHIPLGGLEELSQHARPCGYRKCLFFLTFFTFYVFNINLF